MTRITQSDLDRIRWYHEFDFLEGLTARSQEPDVADHRAVWRFIEAALAEIELKGKSVLDIGCWDGYFSFLAEKRGAGSVLAADDFSQNWGTGEGIALTRKLLNSQVEVAPTQSIYELSRLNRRFDVIFCFGVYYHLLDPLLALAQIRHCCHENTLVLLEGDVWTNSSALSALYGFGSSQHPAFLPTESLLIRLLETSYLRVEKTDWQRTGRGWKGLLKKLIGKQHKERALFHCRPFAGRNPIHEYSAPFGLAQYG